MSENLRLIFCQPNEGLTQEKSISGGSHETNLISCDNAIEDAKRDQKLAAMITPEANPKESSRILRLTDFVKNTIDAPRSVIPHVKRLAMRA